MEDVSNSETALARSRAKAKPRIISQLAWLGPPVLAGAFILVVGILLWLIHHRSLNQQRNSLERAAQTARVGMELHFNGHQNFLELLAEEMERELLNAEIFERRVADYRTKYPALSHLTWADAENVVRWVAPLEANEQLLEIPISGSESRSAALASRYGRSPAYTKPFVAAHGKLAFEVYMPVFWREEFLGTFAGTFWVEPFLREASASSSAENYQIGLVDKSGNAIAQMPGEAQIDRRLVKAVRLDAFGDRVFVQLASYKTRLWDSNLVLLSLLSMGMAVGMGWGMWVLALQITHRLRAEAALKQANDKLEIRVEERTAALKQSEARERAKAEELEQALYDLQQTQEQLVQTEKMSSLGQMVAGIAHEFNNPIGFIYGNLAYLHQYTQDLFELLHLYQQNYPQPVPEIIKLAEASDLDFMMEDLPKLLGSIKLGSERISQIVQSLLHFSRLQESEVKTVDIHEGIDTSLMLLQHRLKTGENAIEVVKKYGDIPPIECSAAQINQVFLNILTNAIDALEESLCKPLTDKYPAKIPIISIRTAPLDNNRVEINIADNGVGISDEVKGRLFDPFFTTKPVGQGTGLGLSISYKIIKKHKGELKCHSAPGLGAEFAIAIPVQQFHP